MVGESSILVAILILINSRSRWRLRSPGNKESKKKEVLKGKVLTIFPSALCFPTDINFP